MTAISYKGHFANVEFDAEDEIFTGRLAGVNDVVGFHADTVENLKAAFREAVDDYIDTCGKAGPAEIHLIVPSKATWISVFVQSATPAKRAMPTSVSSILSDDPKASPDSAR